MDNLLKDYLLSWPFVNTATVYPLIKQWLLRHIIWITLCEEPFKRKEKSLVVLKLYLLTFFSSYVPGVLDRTWFDNIISYPVPELL